MGLSGWANAPAKSVGTVGSASIFTDNIFYLIDPGLSLSIRVYPGLTSVMLILCATLVLDLTEVEFPDGTVGLLAAAIFYLVGLFWEAV